MVDDDLSEGPEMAGSGWMVEEMTCSGGPSVQKTIDGISRIAFPANGDQCAPGWINRPDHPVLPPERSKADGNKADGICRICPRAAPGEGRRHLQWDFFPCAGTGPPSRSVDGISEGSSRVMVPRQKNHGSIMSSESHFSWIALRSRRLLD
jgi:hypothetical protein